MDCDLKAIVQSHLAGKNTLFASVIGSRAFGFPREDSDVDVRGVYLLPNEDFLGITPPKKLSINIQERPVDADYHEIGSAFRLFEKNSPLWLEALFSPRIIISTPQHKKLVGLKSEFVSKKVLDNYEKMICSGNLNSEQIVRCYWLAGDIMSGRVLERRAVGSLSAAQDYASSAYRDCREDVNSRLLNDLLLEFRDDFRRLGQHVV